MSNTSMHADMVVRITESLQSRLLTLCTILVTVRHVRPYETDRSSVFSHTAHLHADVIALNATARWYS